MKPCELVISGFGPFSQKTIIDFTKLNHQGLYLICGDTGAGKTTIFDAISFALYGESSGKKREGMMFRCQNASSDTPTYVELTFLHHQKQYKIMRSPEYERESKRKEGMILQKAQAELYLPDGTVLTKIRDVTKKIEDIIGVTSNQFSHIAMIAQGDFLKLLLASTDERKQIFRQLFHSENYLEIQNTLKKDYLELQSQTQLLRNTIVQEAKNIQSEEIEDSILLDQVKEGMAIDELLALLKKMIEEDEQIHIKTQQQLQQLTDQETKQNTLLEEIKRQYQLKKEKEQLHQQLKQLEEEKELLIKRSKEMNQDEVRDQLLVKIKQLQDTSDQYEKLEQLRQETIQLKKKIQIEETTLQKQKIELETKQIEYQQLTKQQETMNADLDLLTIQQEVEKQARIYEEILVIMKEEQAYQQAIVEYEKKRLLYEQASEKYKQIQANYLTASQILLDEQAGILAKQLQDGKPCPVCGSCHHPNPAMQHNQGIDENYVKKLRQENMSCEKEAISKSSDAGSAKTKMETLQKQYQTHYAKLFHQQIDLKEVSIKQKQVLETMKKQYEQGKEQVKLQEQLKQELPKKLNDIMHLQQLIQTRSNEYHVMDTTLKEKMKQYEEYAKQLPYASKKEAIEAYQIVEKQLKQLELKLKKEKQLLSNQDHLISEIKGKLTIIMNQLTNEATISLEDLQTQLKQITLEKQTVIALEKKQFLKVNQHQRIYESIQVKKEELVQSEEHLAWLGELSHTANGTVSGKEKIMFETYVLMNYFDRMLERANLRFMMMSKGQYELLRKKEASNNRSQSGLELDVIDHYSGSIRSVKTLSGGEAFQASLSLALGLSDEIQHHAGGIHLDAMFIDEGFGSLDEDALEQAIQTLEQLKEGNHIVGIISHVAELKQRIDQQMIVTKDRINGSKVTIIV